MSAFFAFSDRRRHNGHLAAGSNTQHTVWLSQTFLVLVLILDFTCHHFSLFSFSFFAPLVWWLAVCVHWQFTTATVLYLPVSNFSSAKFNRAAVVADRSRSSTEDLATFFTTFTYPLKNIVRTAKGQWARRTLERGRGRKLLHTADNCQLIEWGNCVIWLELNWIELN